MNLSAIAIRRPVFTVMVTLALIVLGLMGYSNLGTDLFPDVSMPVVVVNVPYPGASPTEVEELVTKQVEDAIVSLNGIDRIKSLSRESLSTVIVLFKLEKNIQEAATEVRERVAQVKYKLPQEIKEPAITRIDVSAAPILTYTLLGSGRSLSEIRKFAKDIIKPALEQLDGVAQVNVTGGAEREIHIDLDLAKVDALNLNPLALIGQLRQQNLTVPAGHFDQGTRELSVRTVGEFASIDEIRNLIVATAQDGSATRLKDVARIDDTFEEQRTRVRTNGDPSVTFEIVKQSGTNTVAISDASKAKLATIEKSFPSGYKTNLIIDQARFIKENTHEVNVAIFFGGAMAILVILMFMLDLRSTLISAVALPTSVVATFFIMYVLGFSLNMMTLLALSLAIGLLIDDAVVVRENISKFLERGVEPRTAALEGTKEIALSVFATTLTIVAVFVPVAFMKGIVGQFFRQFGLTISAAVLVSLFVAFTLDPMLSSRFSKPHVPIEKDPFRYVKRPFLAVFNAIDDVYRVLLMWSTRSFFTGAAVAATAIGSFVMMGVVLGLMGNEFVNSEDRSQFVAELELPAGTSLDETARLTEVAERKLLSDKRIVTVLATIGPNGEVNKARWRVVTVPKVQRSVGIIVLKDLARDAAKLIPDAKIAVSDPAFVEGAATEAPIMVQVRANTYEELAPLAREFELALKKIPGAGDVQMKYTPGQPELRVAVDRDRAAVEQMPVAQVALALRASMTGEEAGKFREGKDEIPIRVRMREEDRNSVSAILDMSMWTPKGRVSLRDLAKVTQAEGPAVIEREGRERQIVIWAYPRGRSLGEIVPDLKAAFAKIKLPKSGAYYLDGQIRQMTESNDSFGMAGILGGIFIYIVLASQFESFIHPVTIMTTLPLAVVGAIVALFVTGKTIALGSVIGIILLMGLVTKNAILLLDRALVRVREMGESPLSAIREAGPERLRPILMTSAAMILGMLPTAVSNGEGSEFRAPMAIAVIGGVISSTLLSLIVVPIFYLSIEGIKGWFTGRKIRDSRPIAPPIAAPAEE